MDGALQQLTSSPAARDAAEKTDMETLSQGIAVMIGITNDLLDAEALRLGRLRVCAAPTDLRAVLAECAPSARLGCPFELHLAPDVPAEIEVDALRLRQVRSSRSSRAYGALEFRGATWAILFVR
jgi:signal transduction histidine kinase